MSSRKLRRAGLRVSATVDPTKRPSIVVAAGYSALAVSMVSLLRNHRCRRPPAARNGAAHRRENCPDVAALSAPCASVVIDRDQMFQPSARFEAKNTSTVPGLVSTAAGSRLSNAAGGGENSLTG